MIEADGFYTLKGYQLNEAAQMTAAMEDYLEMICRMHREHVVIRIGELSQRLHVKASSASKMVSALKELGYVHFEKYGYILPTEKGQHAGDYLLHRHDVLHTFLCLLNHSENELEQVEKIEHFFNSDTIENLNRLNKELLLRADLS